MRRGRHLRRRRARAAPPAMARPRRLLDVDSLSKHLDELDLFPAGEPEQAAYRDYRRWAFESAALDLALTQAGARSATSSAARRGRSRSSPRRAAVARRLARALPDLRFKLDPTPEWTDELVRTGRARERRRRRPEGRLPRHRRRQPAERRSCTGASPRRFPDAWIEDPALTPETDAVLEPHRDRITWDAPIHSWADVEALPFPPRCLNCKPSRFGSVERLFEFYDRCEEQGSRSTAAASSSSASAAGRSSCSPGSSIPDGPNDVAPGGYNSTRAACRASRRARSTRAPQRVGFRRAVS